MGIQKFRIESALSNIGWVGKKVTGAHSGSIAVKEGELMISNDQLTGGRIIVDMASMKILDVTDPATNAQFAGHLASDDFFSTEKYPEAVVEITSVSGKHVEGILIIKGISHLVGFDADVQVNRETLVATATLVIDRTKYGMKFDFELNISVTART
jgi:polyisoprenoid-binding protein YceI